jgi:hypothetical protein
VGVAVGVDVGTGVAMGVGIREGVRVGMGVEEEQEERMRSNAYCVIRNNLLEERKRREAMVLCMGRILSNPFAMSSMLRPPGTAQRA